MSQRKATVLIVAALAWVAATGASQAEPEEAPAESSAEKPEKSEKQAKSPIPIYRPPSIGQPARTVGGGTRGPGDGFPSVYVLVPDHPAHTASPQPVLFWYVDDVPPPKSRVRFTLLDEDSVEPLVSATMDPPARAGIHSIRLADHGVSLEPGMEYEWSVAVVVDPEDSAKDVVASGWVVRVAEPTGLGGASGADAVAPLAENGLWYDALAEIDVAMQRRPNDASLPEMRSALLRQVGLDAVATAR